MADVWTCLGSDTGEIYTTIIYMNIKHKLFLLGLAVAYVYFPLYGWLKNSPTVFTFENPNFKHEESIVVHAKELPETTTEDVKPSLVPVPKGNIEKIVYNETVKEFGEDHWESMRNIIKNESGFNPEAKNPKSGACGLGQANPCSKMKCSLTDVSCQTKWVINYIKTRYGNPNNAWNFWQARVQINGVDYGNWY